MISKQDMMPLNSIIVVEILDLWGIYFMGLFPSYFGNEYILLAMEHISKWVEAIRTKTNDARVVVKFLMKNIFARFGMPEQSSLIRVSILRIGHLMLH